MAEATAHSPTRVRQYIQSIGRLITWALLGACGLLVGAHLVFFAVHAAHLLGYPYPLDYGEGPLLAQVNLLRSGTPIWQLYADPDRAPYAVVNYPPLYHLLTALAALPLGNALLAGRLVSLASALAAVAALWLLAGTTAERRFAIADRGQGAIGDCEPIAPSRLPAARVVGRALIVVAWLALPIVREWSVVMRVDMLGVCFGLWGLVVVQRNLGRRAVLWAALPLTLGLLVKPSLIAAPAAALLWLLLRDWRRALLLGGLIGGGWGAATALLQLGSGGWYLLHVLAANANTWDRGLAYGFWHDQLVIVWPLVAATIISVITQIARSDWRIQKGSAIDNLDSSPLSQLCLPLYYTLFGAIVAYGVGKVGAYTNYFLEFYAGLIWLAASAWRWPAIGDRVFNTLRTNEPIAGDRVNRSSVYYLQASLCVTLLLAGALLRYYPTWSENYLKLAGIIEGRNPPRLVIGGYGVWQDLQRERDILSALARINAALVGEVRAAGAPIFTDIPGVAAQAGQVSRLQAFEYRQLLDAGLADQRGLLRDLANGRVPLVVLDYLGNWLTPEMMAVITHRYAQDGSRGIYDLYRPVDPGPAVATDLAFPDGLVLAGYHLAASPGSAAYHGGETVLLTLDWRLAAPNPQTSAEQTLEVNVQVTDARGHRLLEATRPLLYGALAPSSWGTDTIQHIQPLVLPPESPAGAYQVMVTLRSSGRDLAATRALAPLIVQEPAGRQVGEGGYYVPAPLLAAWEHLGGDEGPGDPLMPATPFQGYTLQCFVRSCLQLAADEVQQLPVGELVQLADVGLRQLSGSSAEAQDGKQIIRFSQTGQTLAGAFLEYWRDHGGEAVLGPPISSELIRGERIVQYTRYARLERPAAGGDVRLGRLGEELLRLPGGAAYRWP